MNWKIVGLGLAFLAFADITVWAIYQHGYLGFFELVTANAATELLCLDLVISLALILVWMRADARERGDSFAPFAVVTLAFGVAGPLLYVLRREWREQRKVRETARAEPVTAR